MQKWGFEDNQTMLKGKTTRMTYYNSNQHIFTQTETTKQPSYALHFYLKRKHKSSNITRRKWNFELKMILTWMRWKECKRFEVNVHKRGSKLLPQWRSRGLGDEALKFLEKMGVKSDFTPYLRLLFVLTRLGEQIPCPGKLK